MYFFCKKRIIYVKKYVFRPLLLCFPPKSHVYVSKVHCIPHAVSCFWIDFFQLMKNVCHSCSIGHFLVWTKCFLFFKAEVFCHLSYHTLMYEA